MEIAWRVVFWTALVALVFVTYGATVAVTRGDMGWVLMFSASGAVDVMGMATARMKLMELKGK